MLFLIEGLLNLIFPSREECPLCGSRSPNGDVCQHCTLWLEEKNKQPYCCRCGRPVNKGSLCRECIEREWPFTAARSVGPYAGPLKEAVHRLKYQGKKQLAQPLGRLMVQQVTGEMLYRRVDMVVPIPVTGEKLRNRGFNQARLLARVVAGGLDKPLADILVKYRDTVPQAQLNRQEREKNTRDTFKLAKNVNIYQKKLLLIDDVITTGSTISAAADVLRQAGAGEVLVLTLAATPKYS
ncbi:MAG: ComF family protein [Desulfotomaculum sp.]|nr:ComF family protein [Desulfotomaculum sp.]